MLSADHLCCHSIQLQATSLRPKIDWPVAILRLCLFLHSALPQCHPSTAQSESQRDSSMTQWSLAGQRAGGPDRQHGALAGYGGTTSLPPVGGERSKQPVVHSMYRQPTHGGYAAWNRGAGLLFYFSTP